MELAVGRHSCTARTKGLPGRNADSIEVEWFATPGESLFLHVNSRWTEGKELGGSATTVQAVADAYIINTKQLLLRRVGRGLVIISYTYSLLFVFRIWMRVPSVA